MLHFRCLFLNTVTRKGIAKYLFYNVFKQLNIGHVLSLKTTNESVHATYLCSAVSFRLKKGKIFLSLGRKRFSSSGSGSDDVTILQVVFAPQVMSRNCVRVPAHLLQKPPKKLAPAASSPFKVRRSNRCLKRTSENALKFVPFSPAAQEYARR